MIEGDGAINNIRLHRAKDPVVRIEDGSGNPVEGATVSFLLPAAGASGTFAGSGISLTAQTDSRGLVTGRGLHPNNVVGQFHIRLTASWRGRTASGFLTETNAEPASAGRRSLKKIVLFAIIGGAAAGGAMAAAHGGGNSGAPATAGQAGAAQGTTVSAGPPAFGPPR